MKKVLIFITFSLMLLLSTNTYAQRLVGAWDIVGFSTLVVNEPGHTLSDIGTITFYKDASGELTVDYSILGIETSENHAFRWAISQNMIALQGGKSDFIRTWIIIENKAKEQKWQATDGKNTVYVLTLKKQSKKKK